MPTPRPIRTYPLLFAALMLRAMKKPIALTAPTQETAARWRARLYTYKEAALAEPHSFPALAIRAPQMRTRITREPAVLKIWFE